jgi:hypothetical protein
VAKGAKSLRLCPVREKLVYCDGICRAVDVAGAVKMCEIYEMVLDVLLNCR